MFTHRATYDGPIVALNAIKDAGRKTDYRVVPRAVFTQPSLASVGLTEAESIDAGHEVKTGVSYFKNSGRAKAISETEGIIKLVADAKSGELLGGHILGPHADIFDSPDSPQLCISGVLLNRFTALSMCTPTLSGKWSKDAAKKIKMICRVYLSPKLPQQERRPPRQSQKPGAYKDKDPPPAEAKIENH